MRYIVFGAGAVGGALGGLLATAERRVVFIARGAHAETLRAEGLALVTPSGTVTVRVPTVAKAEEVVFEPDDVVVLAVKSQDTAAALQSLPHLGDIPIVCAQNGVTNEEAAASRSRVVLGMLVWIAALHVKPGTVEVYANDPYGAFVLGPTGNVASAIAADFEAARLHVELVDDVMPAKRGKLLTNTANAIDAYCGPIAEHVDLFDAIVAEGVACFNAAGLPFTDPRDLMARMTKRVRMSRIEGRKREGGSTWQSLRRGASVEVSHLNGYMCALGKQHDVPTPFNRAMVQIAHEGAEPRSVAAERVRQLAAQL